jgi:hypothetical protein
MKVIAFLNNPLEKGLETAKNWLTILKPYEVDILYTPVDRIEDHLLSGYIVISFGKIASTIVRQCIIDGKLTSIQQIELPIVKELAKEERYKQQRQEAFQKLTKLKEFLDNTPNIDELIIKDTDLPDLTTQQILLLSKLMSNRDKSFLVSKDNKVIQIGESDNTDGNICLSWEELFALKMAMDVLCVNEVKLNAGSSKVSNQRIHSEDSESNS